MSNPYGYKIYLCKLSGKALEAAGGEEFQKEVKDLIASQGNLELTGGKLHHFWSSQGGLNLAWTLPGVSTSLGLSQVLVTVN